MSGRRSYRFAAFFARLNCYHGAVVPVSPIKFAIAAVVVALACPVPCGAQDADCRGEPLLSGTVTQVLDGRSFQLDDSRVVRLAGLAVPPSPRAGEPGSGPGEAARRALQDFVASRTIELTAAAKEPDRYGRVVAHVRLTGESRSVQAAMLAGGYAQLAPGQQSVACSKSLLAHEKIARQGKLGVWNDPVYEIATAERPAEILPKLGRFAVVEGKVVSVRESRGIIYVNFGRRWTQDFALTIRKSDEQAFLAAGVNVRHLEGQTIRMRGWIAQRGGPRIEAQTPDQIEIAARR